ncbi:Roadblock/LAMTOR2 domain-containing protein [Madurella fahalii]|uniref:Roadblock/LAMTOR2 domain-containing protein n=1 Tax=Madurella fahalii TaxID=1157608 RepID=A0ABQ0G378_9PEZI
MTDPVLGAGPDVLEETLGRLSKKAGVRATMVLDRTSGAILKTSGQVSSIRKTKATAPSIPAVGSFSNEPSGNSITQDQGAEELASMVWNFVSTAGSFVQELDTEDEVKLLRLRTKKQEFVIVPDAKYLLIVVHDTSSA